MTDDRMFNRRTVLTQVGFRWTEAVGRWVRQRLTLSDDQIDHMTEGEFERLCLRCQAKVGEAA